MHGYQPRSGSPVTSYYFTPINLYVGGGFGVVSMSLDAPGVIAKESELGFAAKLATGKEWWVSPKWGLGLAVETMLGAVPDREDEDSGWGIFGLSLAFSATYN